MFVVPVLTNPILSTTMVAREEQLLLDLCADLAECCDHLPRIAHVGSAKPPRATVGERLGSARDFDRPRFCDEQCGFVAGDFEHIPDLVSRQVHAVDIVRQPPR